MLLLGRRRREVRTLRRKAPDRQESQKKSHQSQKFAPDRQKGSNKIRDTTRFFGSALCCCWVGGVEGSELSYVRHLTVRRVKKKSHPSQKFAPDRQKGSDKIRETTRFFGSALCFCWVGGVEWSELSYVRHLTVRRVKIKATCHKKGSICSIASLGVTPEAKTYVLQHSVQPARKRAASCFSSVAGRPRSWFVAATQANCWE